MYDSPCYKLAGSLWRHDWFAFVRWCVAQMLLFIQLSFMVRTTAYVWKEPLPKIIIARQYSNGGDVGGWLTWEYGHTFGHYFPHNLTPSSAWWKKHEHAPLPTSRADIHGYLLLPSFMNKTWPVKEFSIELRGRLMIHLFLKVALHENWEAYLRKPDNIVDPLGSTLGFTRSKSTGEGAFIAWVLERRRHLLAIHL